MGGGGREEARGSWGELRRAGWVVFYICLRGATRAMIGRSCRARADVQRAKREGALDLRSFEIANCVLVPDAAGRPSAIKRYFRTQIARRGTDEGTESEEKAPTSRGTPGVSSESSSEHRAWSIADVRTGHVAMQEL